MNYYNLQVHSCYDLLNSTVKIDRLFEKLHNDDAKVVCITDPNLYGAIKINKIATKYNINVINGLEISVSYGLDFIKINVLCKNEKMFKILFKLSTLKEEKKEITIEELLSFIDKFKDDCILIIVYGIRDKYIFNEINSLLRDYDFYFGINEEYRLDLYNNVKNIVYSKPSYYLNQEDYSQFLVSRAIKDNNKLDIKMLGENYGDEYVKTKSDVEKLVKRLGNENLIVQAIKNQEKIVSECIYNLDFKGYHLPKYKYSKEEESFKNLSSDDYLKYLILKGVKKKLSDKNNIDIYRRRYEYEFKIISEMGFSDYFLIVYDFVKYAKSNEIFVGPGRGSAAGSLICYLLDITEADPIEYNLLFERFLNKERISMPDIDIDFQDTRRDEVIKYVEEKYGSKKVAQIITFTTFQSKSSARESARILNYSEADLKYISTFISSTKTLEVCYNESEQLRTFVNKNENNKKWFKIALGLEGLPKNPSIHAAGIIISDNYDLEEHVPLSNSVLTEYITQWTMDDVEYVGLLKIDFLGIRYLTMLANIEKEIKKVNPKFNIKNIDYDDEKVYKLFAKGETEGIFQFESSGMKEKLRILEPTNLNDLTAMNALYRPGPMAQIETYIKRKHGQEKVKYIHPNLEKILKDTYGIIVYQEQIMLIAVNFAHMTLNEADNMRRAVGKKKKADLEKYGELFIKKSLESGYDLSIAKELFNLIVTFANYGFNKSHSLVYSMIAYQLAYLKVYYPLYFMTYLLNNVINNDKKINEYKQELKNIGLQLIAPNINISLRNFSVNNNNISFALLAIKNVGNRGAYEIVNERKNYGIYRNLDDFLKRLDKKIDYQASVSLVKSGAMDIFGYNRATLIKKIKEYYEDTRENIDNLRMSLAKETGLTPKIEEVEDYSIQEKIAMEKEVTGTYFIKHPVQVTKEEFSYLPLRYLGNKITDSYVEVVSKKEIKTKNGEYMAFLTVNDSKNDYDVTVFPNVYKYASVLLKENSFFVLTLKPQKRNERVQYILEKIALLEKYNEYLINNVKSIYILLNEEIKTILGKYIDKNSSFYIIVFNEDNLTLRRHIPIKNEQLFVREILDKGYRKHLKIGYGSGEIKK